MSGKDRSPPVPQDTTASAGGDWARLVAEAIDQSDEGNYLLAVDALSTAIALDASRPQAFFERAVALINLERTAEALLDLDSCLALDPAFPGARKWRATALKDAGNLRAAAEEQLRSLREHPDDMGVNPQQWADCAEAYALLGDSAMAVRLLDEYVSTHARHVQSYRRVETAPLRLLARLLIDASEAGRALPLAKAAYENTNHRVPADIATYAHALEAVGQRAEALKVVDEALAINDEMEEAIAVKARLLRN